MCGFSTVKEMECIKHSTVDGKNPSWHSVCFDLHVTKWIKQVDSSCYVYLHIWSFKSHSPKPIIDV